MRRSGYYGGGSPVDEYFNSFTRSSQRMPDSDYYSDHHCSNSTRIPSTVITDFSYYPNVDEVRQSSLGYAEDQNDHHHNMIFNVNHLIKHHHHHHHVPNYKEHTKSQFRVEDDEKIVTPEADNNNWYGIRGGDYGERNIDTAADRFIQQKHNNFQYGR